jgi:hypothetical protein
MLKILSGTFIVILVLLAVVFAAGIRTGSTVDTEFEVNLAFSREYIYDLIAEIEKYPERKNGLKKLEILERKGSEIVAWRENYMGGSWKEMRLVEKYNPNYFVYEIYDSSSGHTAVMSFDLSENRGFTSIKLKEQGSIPGTFMRGLRFLRGDNSYLEAQVKWIRVAINRELIERE